MYSLIDILSLAGRDTKQQTLCAASVGLILPLIAEGPLAAQKGLGWHMDRIIQAVALDQLPIYFDRFGRLAGHVLWTQVDPALDRALLKSGSQVVGAAELSHQGVAWILDFNAMFGELPTVLRDMRDQRLARQDTVTYFRYKRGRRIAKRIARSDRSSFFLHPRPVHARNSDWPLMRKDGKDLLHAAAAVLDAAIELGRCLGLMRSLDEFAGMPLPLALNRLRAPLAQMQSRLYVSATGKPTALMTWAWLDCTGLERAPLPAPQALAPFEWNEGGMLCLCDAIALPAGLPDMAADLAGRWFPSEDFWVYPRTSADAACAEPFVCWELVRRAELVDLQAGGSVALNVAAMLLREGVVPCLG